MRKIISLLSIVLLVMLLGCTAYVHYSHVLESQVSRLSANLGLDIVFNNRIEIEKTIESLRGEFPGVRLALNEEKSSCFLKDEFTLRVDGIKVGSLIDCPNFSSISKSYLKSNILIVLLLVLIILGLIFLILPLYLYKLEISDFIKKSMSRIETGQLDNIELSDRSLSDIQEIILKVADYKAEIRGIQIERTKERQLREMAESVAHDIRSPLSALQIGVPLAIEGSSEARNLVNSAVERIQAIASELMISKKTVKDASLAFDEVKLRFDVDLALQDILREKA